MVVAGFRHVPLTLHALAVHRCLPNAAATFPTGILNVTATAISRNHCLISKGNMTIRICLSSRKVIVADESHIAGYAGALSGIVRFVQSGRRPAWQYPTGPKGEGGLWLRRYPPG